MKGLSWLFLIAASGFSLAAAAQSYEVKLQGASRLQDSRKIDGILWNCKGDVCRTDLNVAHVATVTHCRKLVAVVGPVRSYTRLVGSRGPALTPEQIAQCNAPRPIGPPVVPGVTPPAEGIQPNMPRQLPPGTQPEAKRPPTAEASAPAKPPAGLAFRTPQFTVSGREVAATAFVPVAFTTVPMSVSGAPVREMPAFKPQSFRTPTMTVTGAPAT